MKTKLLKDVSMVSLVGTCFAALSAGAYETATLTKNDGATTALTAAGNWSNNISPLDDAAADYDYVVGKSGIRTPGCMNTFQCHSMTYGTDAQAVTLYEKGTTQTFKDYGPGSGLFLYRGTWDTWYDNTAKIYGPVTVTTPAGKTFSFVANRSKDNAYAFYGTFSSSRDDVKIRVQNSATSNGTLLTLHLHGDASGYTGSIDVQAASCLQLVSKGPTGEISLSGAGAHLDLGTQGQALTLRSFDCAAGSKITTWATVPDSGATTVGSITADKMTVTGPVAIVLNESKQPTFSIDLADEFLLLAAKDASFSENDFTLTVNDTRHACPVPLKLVVRDEDGYHKLLAVRKSVVYLDKTVQSSAVLWNDATQWNDKNPPHGDVDYCNWSATIRPSGLETFPSEFLAMAGGNMILQQNVTEISNLVATVSKPNILVWHDHGDRTTNAFATAGTRYLRGKILLKTNIGFSATVAKAYVCIQSDISGSSSTQVQFSRGNDTDYYELAGDNSDFNGIVNCYASQTAFDADHDNGIYLYVSEEKNLGRMQATTFANRHVNLSGGAILRQKLDTLTLTNPYNALYVETIAGFEPMVGQTMNISSPLNFAGTLYKFGAGKLALGGPAPTFESGGVSTPTEGKNVLVVSEGGLLPASADAFKNLKVVFEKDGKLLAYLPGTAPAAVADCGLKLDWTDPLALNTADGKLHVALDVGTVAVPESGVFPIITVPEAKADLLRNGKIVVDKPARSRAVRVFEGEAQGGFVTFFGEISHPGMLMLFR